MFIPGLLESGRRTGAHPRGRCNGGRRVPDERRRLQPRGRGGLRHASRSSTARRSWLGDAPVEAHRAPRSTGSSARRQALRDQRRGHRGDVHRPGVLFAAVIDNNTTDPIFVVGAEDLPFPATPRGPTLTPTRRPLRGPRRRRPRRPRPWGTRVSQRRAGRDELRRPGQRRQHVDDPRRDDGPLGVGQVAPTASRRAPARPALRGPVRSAPETRKPAAASSTPSTPREPSLTTAGSMVRE